TATLARLVVHVYRERQLNGSVYRIQAPGIPAVAINTPAADIQTQANRHLKSMVINAQVNAVTLQNIPYDLNGNGHLDLIENINMTEPGNYELAALLTGIPGISNSDALVVPNAEKALVLSSPSVRDTIFLEYAEPRSSTFRYKIGPPNMSGSTSFTVNSHGWKRTRRLVIEFDSLLPAIPANVRYVLRRTQPDTVKFMVVRNAAIGDQTFVIQGPTTNLLPRQYYDYRVGGNTYDTLRIQSITPLAGGNQFEIRLFTPLRQNLQANRSHLFRMDDFRKVFQVPTAIPAGTQFLRLNTSQYKLNFFEFSGLHLLPTNRDLILEREDGTGTPLKMLILNSTITGMHEYYWITSTRVGVHPFVPGNHRTNHIVVPDRPLGSLRGTSSDLATRRPAGIATPSDNADYLGFLFAHEQGHGASLRDVNQTNNIMHYNADHIRHTYTRPFRFQILKTVITGTNKPDNQEQSQWEAVVR
ncbi:MAG TPA: hypothetical protein DCP28_21860, partial [Cytophagales bacterium]|nr:hypothetical protein [Cytophagales bacterium]